jgi:uncharacterized membrane protein
MFNKVTVSETHIRTIVKAAAYRLVSVVAAIILTLILGGNPWQAVTMGGIALFIGSLHYYIYDRLWLFIPWHRDDQGKDSWWRSTIKAVIYRITALIILMILARMVFAETNLIAFLLAAGKFIINAIAYLLLERLFNWIQWGKVCRHDY